MRSHLFVLGIDHTNAPVEQRDRCAIDAGSVVEFEAALRGGEIEEAAVLSTCNRTEHYVVVSSPQAPAGRILETYRNLRGVDVAEPGWTPRVELGEEATRHLMRVASGLESMMLGENQILTQVKETHERILVGDAPRPLLARLFQEAVRAGKRVRAKTALCQGAVSISQAAVALARKAFSKLESRRFLIIGAGVTSELVIRHLRSHGASRFAIANRSRDNAQKLVDEHGGMAIGLEAIPEALSHADVVFSATASPGLLVHREQVEPVLRQRQGRPLVLVDISTPRDLDPAIGELSTAFLHNIDHLQMIVDESLERRRAEIPAAEVIVSRLTKNYWQWVKSLQVTPTIARLTEYFNDVRDQELSKMRSKTDDDEFLRLEKLSHSLVKKLLHFPIQSLREMSNGERMDRSLVKALWRMYRLEEDDAPPKRSPDDETSDKSETRET